MAHLKSKPTADAAKQDRPLGPYSRSKVEKILKAAKRLFTDQGFAATSMDAVAARANVGKATVYSHFKSKDELFRAVINAEAVQPLGALESANGEDFEVTLCRFAEHAFDVVLSPTNIATFRAVAAEASRSANLGQIFYENGPVVLIDALAAFLGKAMEQGQIRTADARLAATQFLGLLCSDLQVRALLGQSTEISPTLKHTVVSEGVATFLHGYCRTGHDRTVRTSIAPAG